MANKHIGEPVYTTLLDAVDHGEIRQIAARDLAKQLHPKVGGSFIHASTDRNFTFDRRAMREILSNWFQTCVPEDPKKDLIRALRHEDVSLLALAHKLEALPDNHVSHHNFSHNNFSHNHGFQQVNNFIHVHNGFQTCCPVSRRSMSEVLAYAISSHYDKNIDELLAYKLGPEVERSYMELKTGTIVTSGKKQMVFQLVRIWQETEGRGATLERIVAVLREMRCVAIAERLEEECD